MENWRRLKLKRKEFDESNDERVFADFCLSSPASKIRRLDADLSPIIEEDVAGIPRIHDQPIPIPESTISNGAINQLNPSDVEFEEVLCIPENNEKAVVLFKPMHNPLSYSPNNLSVDPSLVSIFRNQALLHTYDSITRPSEEDDKVGSNMSRAIIPWAPSQQPLHQQPILSPEDEVSDPMEVASMLEIEDANQSRLEECVQQYHQWQQQQQQQQCMILERSHNTCTTPPIVWHG